MYKPQVPISEIDTQVASWGLVLNHCGSFFSEEFCQWKYQNIHQRDKFVSIGLRYLRNVTIYGKHLLK